MPALILTVIFNPVGIAGKTRADFDKMLAKRRPRRASTAEVETLGEALEAMGADGDAIPEPTAARTIGDVLLRTDGIR